MEIAIHGNCKKPATELSGHMNMDQRWGWNQYYQKKQIMDGLWSLRIDYDDTTIEYWKKPNLALKSQYIIGCLLHPVVWPLLPVINIQSGTFTSRFIKISVSRIG
jgi:hypothetical protein